MRGFVRKSLGAAVLLGVAAQSGVAQATASAPVCEPNQSSPAPVARATLFLQKAFAAMKGGNPSKDLREAIGQLSDPKAAAENPIGTNLMLGQAYVLFLQTPGATGIMRRGDVGFTTNPDGVIDIYAAADSAFDVVEARAPECVATAAQWRQQGPWLAVTNNAINALNANKLDSAEIYAKWSLALSDKVPYAYSVLAGVAKARNDNASATKYWQQALKSAEGDTSYNDVRLKTYYEMSTDAVARAEAATGAAKLTAARAAVTALQGYLAANPNDYQTTAALQNMTRMYIALGDTARIADVYAPIIKNPLSWGESTLLQAGVTATRYNKTADAVKLFEAALRNNPYQRDALNNLAASYINSGQFEKVPGLVSRLLALDPNNPDNVLMNAYLYSGLLKAAKTAKDRKLYTDSLVYYKEKSDKMPLKISFSEFSRTESEVILAGEIENRGTTSKTFNVYFEFIDKAGNVVATGQSAVGPVAPKAKQTFRVKVAAKDVAAYRYRPIT
ncbi:MAG: tetratricopeptide repeat protein [Gemmatimonadaceae bacterium]|nr:tetratricopeptide repeat protein [Gemmatimonadaceae bacterium]